MVWDGGDMAAQYAEGIAVAVICLNLHAAQRVRVVTGPELGYIAQKAQICFQKECWGTCELAAANGHRAPELSDGLFPPERRHLGWEKIRHSSLDSYPI